MLPLRAAASFPSRKFRSTASIYEKTGLEHGEPVRSMARQNLEFSWSYHLRLASLLSSRQRARLISTVHTSDYRQLSQSLGAVPGFVLVSAHLGDFEIAGAWLKQRTGREVVAVVETLSQRVRQWFFDATRHACGIKLRRAENTSITDLEDDLLAGRIVVLMLDRQGGAPSVPVTLFETPAEVSILPYLLSSRTGAPIIAAATITSRSGARRIYLSEPLTADQRPGQVMQKIAHTIDAFIRRAPQQWHVPADTSLLPLTDADSRQQSSSRDARPITLSCEATRAVRPRRCSA
jgi:lauroyl/myristoyl acyltransferase